MYKVFTIVSCLLVSMLANAAGIPLLLKLKWQNAAPDAITQVLVEADRTKMIQYLENTGIRTTTSKGNIFVLTGSIKQIRTLASKSFVTSIEDGNIPVQLMNDTSLINSNIEPIHAGTIPLLKAYTGKNVIIGIVDDGLDWRHQDFKNADSSTRILYLWDQNNATPSKAPLPYNYGQEWNAADINTNIITYMEPGGSFSHGSNVTGIAAGNGRASGMFKGTAPDANIIVVAPKYNNNFTNNVLDAIDYVFKKADAMGMPCVVNTSLGTYYGSHDGKDLSAKLIDLLLEERKGRVVVAAAGNAGGINYHLGYNEAVGSDTVFTWFRYLASANGVYFDFWADSAALGNVKFGLQADSVTPYKSISDRMWFDYKKDFPNLLTQKTSAIVKNILSTGGSFLGTASIQIDLIDGRFFVQINIIPNSQAYQWKFCMTGAGAFDLWSHPSTTGTSQMVETALPDTNLFPEFKKYKFPDNQKNIVSSWQCSDKVITVGNYNNRFSFRDIDSIERFSGFVPGVIFPTSSNGPTRDNRIKPDISAPGNFVVSSMGLNTRSSFLVGGNRAKVARGSWHMRNGGTSMASPQVAGTAALFLEQNPNLGYTEIKQLILRTAKKDSFTTNSIPNNIWGYGKLNAFDAMTFSAIFGCMDTGRVNYNPNANIDNGLCIKKVYGCTDTGSINYNPKANVDNKSCVKKKYGCTDKLALNYDSTANVDNGTCKYKNSSIQISSNLFAIYPNPVQEKLVIKSARIIEKMQVVNTIGQQVYLLQNGLNQNETTIDFSTMSHGIYTLKIYFAHGEEWHTKLVKE